MNVFVNLGNTTQLPPWLIAAGLISKQASAKVIMCVHYFHLYLPIQPFNLLIHWIYLLRVRRKCHFIFSVDVQMWAVHRSNLENSIRTNLSRADVRVWQLVWLKLTISVLEFETTNYFLPLDSAVLCHGMGNALMHIKYSAHRGCTAMNEWIKGHCCVASKWQWNETPPKNRARSIHPRMNVEHVKQQKSTKRKKSKRTMLYKIRDCWRPLFRCWWTPCSAHANQLYVVAVDCSESYSSVADRLSVAHQFWFSALCSHAFISIVVKSCSLSIVVLLFRSCLFIPILAFSVLFHIHFVFVFQLRAFRDRCVCGRSHNNKWLLVCIKLASVNLA